MLGDDDMVTCSVQQTHLAAVHIARIRCGGTRFVWPGSSLLAGAGRAVDWRCGPRCRCSCSTAGWRLERPLAGQLQTQLRLQVQLCIVHNGLPPAKAVPQNALRRIASRNVTLDEEAADLADVQQGLCEMHRCSCREGCARGAGCQHDRTKSSRRSWSWVHPADALGACTGCANWNLAASPPHSFICSMRLEYVMYCQRFVVICLMHVSDPMTGTEH